MINEKMITILTIAILFNSGITQSNPSSNTTDPNRRIGEYVIPNDILQDNYCQKYNVSDFHDIKEFQTQYEAFFLSKVKDLREPIYNFLKLNKLVSDFEQFSLIFLWNFSIPELVF